MRTKLILVMAVIIGITPAAFGQSNGSFEAGEDPGIFQVKFAGSTDITDWTVTGSVDYIGTYWQASDGDRSIDLAGNFAGGLSQSIATTPGYVYVVSFDMSGNPAGPPALKRLEVTADGGNSQTYSYTTGTNTLTNMQWETNTYYFTATSTETLIAFNSLTSLFYGPALDNVALDVVNQVCHRNQGRRGSKTLTIGAPAVAAHLAHGDTPGPCPEISARD
jgi:choice-of-anchor C domain-containing protein